MKTREVLIYTYDELSDKAKSRARDWYREGDDFDPEFILEDAATIAAILGIDFQQMPVKLMNGKTKYEPKIYWELGRPGAGAVFEGRYRFAENSVDRLLSHAPTDETLARIAETLADNQAANGDSIIVDIVFRYCGPGLPAMEFDDASGMDDHQFTPESFKEVCEALKDFAVWIHGQLEAELEYRSKDETVEENIRANEYEFFENGGRA